jgi:hypothetical protein
MASDSGEKGGKPKGERRRFARFETQLPVHTRRDDLIASGQSECRAGCRLKLQDFSLGGLKVESSVPLKARERLTLRLPPSATRPETEITGRVIRCRRRDTRYEVGIELCQFGADPLTSPYRQLPRLFSIAADYAPGDLIGSAAQS